MLRTYNFYWKVSSDDLNFVCILEWRGSNIFQNMHRKLKKYGMIYATLAFNKTNFVFIFSRHDIVENILIYFKIII